MSTRLLTSILAIGVIFFATGTFATERLELKFGKIEAEYIQMTRYEADTSAKALIIGDVGDVRISYFNPNGFEYVFTRHVRIKVFDRDAFDLANFSIYLYDNGQSRERLVNLKAVSFTPEDGRVVKTKLSRENRFIEQVNDNLQSINFTVPNIGEGTVFDVEYTLRSPFLATLPPWSFQSAYPTLASEFSTQIPEYFFYKKMMQGFLTLSDQKTTSRPGSFEVVWNVDPTEQGFHSTGSSRRSQKVDYVENITSYSIYNVPAFKTEPYSNSMINYITRIEHELQSHRFEYGPTTDYSSTWAQLNKRLLDSESFGKRLTRSRFMNSSIDSIAALTDNQLERLQAAFTLVQDRMTWNEYSRLYSSQNLAKSWEEKSGNSTDINFILLVMLRELGIEANPVILSTRSNGIINPTQIMLDRFNYTIVQARIDGEDIFLDASEKHTPYYLLPTRCINGQGRIVHETIFGWVDLQAIKDNSSLIENQIEVQPCGSLVASMSTFETSYNRYDAEDEYRSCTNDDEYMDKFEDENDGAELDDFSIENMDNWSVPLVRRFKFTIPAPDSNPKDLIYINPFLTQRLESNPFKLDNRQYPVDFVFPITEKMDVTIVIPQGYTVETLPSSANFTLPSGAAKYKTEYSIQEETGNIILKVEREMVKTLYLPAEYNSLKDYYAKIVADQAQNIVLKKIG